jgi:hypothetical protein
MRTFVEIRRAAADFKEIEDRIEELERKTEGKLAEHEKHLVAIFKVLKELAAPPAKKKHPIGFAAAQPDEGYRPGAVSGSFRRSRTSAGTSRSR